MSDFDADALVGEVAVPIVELTALRGYPLPPQPVYDDDVDAAVRSLIARIPEPPWEPTDELQEVIRQADLGGLVMTGHERIAVLRALHDAGALREDEDR